MKNFILAFVVILISIYTSHAQVAGCPDPAALNYDSLATVNDGSCTYSNANINPKLRFNLSRSLDETSGLLYWKKKIWTHNDSGGDAALYELNNNSGVIEDTVLVTNATNVDWEDLAQDNAFIYIGDFGNNANGNRTDLKIYKIAKADINAGGNVTAAVINFSYEDQTDFSPKGSNNTDFDCEAMIVNGDSIFLFSKDWLDNKTRLYKLPKTPGTYSAVKLAELDVQGLITGADILSAQRVIVLSGYSTALSPFIYLLYDFSGNNFFAANKRKVELGETLTQAEGICAVSPVKFYLSNERFQQLFLITPAKVQNLNLAGLLTPYYSSQKPVRKPQIDAAVTMEY